MRFAGITRMERWKRAEKHGLNPSELVKQTVEAHEDDERYTEWYAITANYRIFFLRLC